jgi:hypothetical protein
MTVIRHAGRVDGQAAVAIPLLSAAAFRDDLVMCNSK